MPVNFNLISNRFLPLPEKQRSYQELCTGMETMEPKFSVDRSRLIAQFQLNKNMIRMDSYCDSESTSELYDTRLNNDIRSSKSTKMSTY